MKAKFGAIVVAGSGKIGGHVASRNRGGAYFRTKVTPVNPQTTSQLTVRNRFTTYSQAWKGLTDAQRAAWNAAVGNYTTTDIFGDIKNPSGFNLYQRINNNLVTVGAAALSIPAQPSSVSQVSITSIIPDDSSQLIPMVLSGNVPAGTAVKVFATPMQSPGVKFVKSEYRLITTLPAATVTPVALGTTYITKFGAIVVGAKIFFKLVFVNTTTGQESSGVEYVATVVA